MEYYSSLKRNKILTYATTWVDLKNIILSEISQIQKDLHDSTHMKYLQAKS